MRPPPPLAAGAAALSLVAAGIWWLGCRPTGRALRKRLLQEAADCCARWGFVTPISLLHRLGLDMQSADPTDPQPLITAASAGHTAVVRQLLRTGGARPPAALEAAIRGGHAGVVDALLRAQPLPRWLGGAPGAERLPSGADPVVAAAESGAPGVVHVLLDHHCAVDTALEDGTTPLIRAAELGLLPVVELLLRCGADVERQRWDGCTAFLIAAQNGHTPVVDRLLDVQACHVPMPGSGGVVHGGFLAAAAAAS